ncbi:MAG: hypothetical protein AAGF12_16615 [Myxococcota bacterium]
MWKYGIILVLGLTVAQSNPAEAQNTRVVGGQFRQQTVVDDTLLRQGRFELALNFAGAYSQNTISQESGESSTQKNTYANPALIVGYMLTDHIELRLSLGLQYLASSVNDGDTSQTTFAGVAAVQGLYQRDFVLGLAGYAGIGLGGYYGFRNVPSETMVGFNEERTQLGGLAQLLLGLMVQPSARLLLRGGFRLDLLFGTDRPSDDTSMMESSSAFNIQVLAEFSIGWRFG